MSDLRALTDAVLQRATGVRTRADDVRAKLSARKGRAGFAQNTADLERALSEENGNADAQES